MADKKIEICEIECLNLDDLDVEELERRLEMSVSPNFEECTTDGSCTTDCGSNNICTTDCGANNICVAQCNLCGCDGACGVDLWPY